MVRHQDPGAVTRWDRDQPFPSIEAHIAPGLRRAYPLPDVEEDLFRRLLDAMAEKEKRCWQ